MRGPGHVPRHLVPKGKGRVGRVPQQPWGGGGLKGAIFADRHLSCGLLMRIEWEFLERAMHSFVSTVVKTHMREYRNKQNFFGFSRDKKSNFQNMF